ncbi:MAG: DUF421 domain-containing protein [Propionibacteriaceae bacterium]|jgi:uncharacterized membrane protein YcaP (DUF421 family)|nr:DUF421 domain-containing protein [Propionibacteriaceae bacterium]
MLTRYLWDHLGISGWDLLALFIGATVLFWVFTFLMSYFGQRMRARVTITTVALMAVIGSVTARAMLGPNPTMVGGIVVLIVLFAWEGVFRLVGARLPQRLMPAREAQVVLRDGVVDPASLKTARIRQTDLMVRLRRAGVTALAQVAYAIIENDGTLTIIRVGETVDPELLVGVVGAP